MELLPGVDGKCRVARVRVKEGVLIRPLQRLYPLEISSKSEVPPVSMEDLKKLGPSVPVEEPNQSTTRAGRNVKKPQRYGWN
jgi:hypothetical protein